MTVPSTKADALWNVRRTLHHVAMDVDDPDVLARIEEACDAIDDRRGLLLGAPQADPERLQAARDLVITRLVEVVLVNASDDTTGCLRTVNEL